jgi:hypothetical protein
MGALMPIRLISVATCTWPALTPSCDSRSCNIRAPVTRQSIARQCPRRGKEKFRVQLVPSRRLHANDCGAADPAPQLQIGVRDRAAGNDAATADAQHAGLAADAELRCAIDHFLRATLAHRGMRRRATGQQTRLAERTGYRSRDRGPHSAAKTVRSIVLQRQLSDFRMQRLHVDRRLRLGFRRRAKNPGGAFQELIAPLPDLVGVSGTQTCPAGNRWTSKSCASSTKIFSPLIAATGAFFLKAGLAVPARSSCHGHLLARGNHAAVAWKIQLFRAVSFPEPPLVASQLGSKAAAPCIIGP